MKEVDEERSRETRGPDQVRRKLLRATALMGGAFAAGQLPYEKPAWKTFLGTRAAWAQGTGAYTLTCSATATLAQGPGTVCQNGVITGAMAQVSPIPPVGTLLRCTPTTDDPANATLPNFSATTAATNASGEASFGDFQLVGNVPNPPLAVGSILTMTVTFDNPGLGNATCVTQFTVVASC